jgi:hypothetical protein
LVYCVEGADHGGKVMNLSLPADAELVAEHRPQLLGGVTVLTGQARASVRKPDGSATTSPVNLSMIPYYAWCHRGPNEMQVWIPLSEDLAELPPVPTIASEAQASASHCNASDSISALNDQQEPANSADHSIQRLTWWNHKGTAEWVQYEFDKPRKVSAIEIYRFDDSGQGACRIPESWHVLYRKDGKWQAAHEPGSLKAELNKFNRAELAPVTTDALRVEVQLQDGYSGGVLEWRVE